MYPLSKFSALTSKRNADHTSSTVPQVSASTAGISTPSRSKSVSIRSLLHRPRKPTTEVASASTVSPEVKALAIAFANSLTAQRVSDFLSWFLFFDVVQLPESPAAWYAHIDAMDMRGWITLGTYLRETAVRGMNIVVLDSICDRIGLQRTTVHRCLIQFSDPQKMARTQLASIVAYSKSYETEVDRWEFVRGALHDFYKMAQRLKPTPESIWEDWQAQSEMRLRGFLTAVVAKRLDHHKLGTQLLWYGTSSQLPKETYETFRLNYLFEAMQQDRPVPLIRYGIISEPKGLAPCREAGSENRALPAIQESFGTKECELERSFSVAKIRSENAHLRGENEILRRHNEALIEANEVLVRKFTSLGRSSALPTRPNGDPTSASMRNPLVTQPRPLSDGAALEYSSIFRQIPGSAAAALASTMPLTAHPMDIATMNFIRSPRNEAKKRLLTSSASLTPGTGLESAYEDVFAALEEKPLPPLPLLHPKTGSPLSKAEPPCPSSQPPHTERKFGATTPTSPTRASRIPARHSMHAPSSARTTPSPKKQWRKSVLLDVSRSDT